MRRASQERREVRSLTERIHQEIHRLRIKAGLSSKELVKKANLSERGVYLMYHGAIAYMEVDALVAIAAVLGKKLEIRFVNLVSVDKQLRLVDNTLHLAKEVGLMKRRRR